MYASFSKDIFITNRESHSEEFYAFNLFITIIIIISFSLFLYMYSCTCTFVEKLHKCKYHIVEKPQIRT